MAPLVARYFAFLNHSTYFAATYHFTIAGLFLKSPTFISVFFFNFCIV